jgi:hypothetical protein
MGPALTHFEHSIETLITCGPMCPLFKKSLNISFHEVMLRIIPSNQPTEIPLVETNAALNANKSMDKKTMNSLFESATPSKKIIMSVIWSI